MKNQDNSTNSTTSTNQTNQTNQSNASDKESVVTQDKSKQIQLEAQTLEKILQQISQNNNETKSNFSSLVKEKINQFGNSAITAITALVFAILTPFVLNSQIAKDVNQSISSIRNQLPKEADTLLVKQLFSLTNDHQSKIDELKGKYQIIISENQRLNNDRNNAQTKQENLLSNMKNFELQTQVQDKNIEALKSKILFLEKTTNQLASTIQSKPKIETNKKLLQQLTKIYQEGELLTANKKEKIENWLKKLNYVVIGLQTGKDKNALKNHRQTLNNIINKKNNFSQFKNRKEEALLILDSILILVNSAILK